MDRYKSYAEMEMAAYDQLSPEWRALVREYNYMPSKCDTIESYLAWVGATRNEQETI